MVKKTPKLPKKSFNEIQRQWEKIQSLDIKNKLKAFRSIGNDIHVSYEKKETSVEQLEFYIKVIKQVIQTRSFPQSASRFLAKLTSDWIELTANDQTESLLKKAGKIVIEAGLIMIADPNYFALNELTDDYSDKNILNLINQGKLYAISTSGDGLFNVQVRIVDSLEPLLTAKEIKYVVDSSESAVIHITSGSLMVADPSTWENEKQSILLNSVVPGNYKVCVYSFIIPNKLESFYIVLSKTELEANNHLSSIYSLNF